MIESDDYLSLVADLAEEIRDLHLALDPAFQDCNCDVLRRAQELLKR